LTTVRSSRKSPGDVGRNGAPIVVAEISMRGVIAAILEQCVHLGVDTLDFERLQIFAVIERGWVDCMPLYPSNGRELADR